jgi:hypothetical protein
MAESVSTERASISVTVEADVRFSYLKEKVMQLQVWREEGGALFRELQAVAAEIMGGVARACGRRFGELLREDGAPALSALGCYELSGGKSGGNYNVVYGRGCSLGELDDGSGRGNSFKGENNHRCNSDVLAPEGCRICYERYSSYSTQEVSTMSTVSGMS